MLDKDQNLTVLFCEPGEAARAKRGSISIRFLHPEQFKRRIHSEPGEAARAMRVRLFYFRC